MVSRSASRRQAGGWSEVVGQWYDVGSFMDMFSFHHASSRSHS